MIELPPVAILAGGLAKRLRPITETIPKALVDINGIPFIIHQLNLLKKQGLTKLVYLIGYKGEMIQKLLGDGSQFGLKIDYSFDGEKLLGTGGAIKKALHLLGSEFFILYGDSYLQIDYQNVKQAFDQSEKKGLLTVFKNEGKWDTSNVYFKDNTIMAYSKKKLVSEMTYIDYGLSIVKSEVFCNYQTDEVFDLGEVYETLAEKKQLAGFVATKRFFEIGSLNGIKDLENFLHS